MVTMKRRLVIVGGGPAGMAAAVAAYDAGETDILMLEREDALGGILCQCIHNGFGLHRFGEELTGPEYAWRYEEEVRARGIDYMLGTTVIELTAERTLTAMNRRHGVFRIEAGAVILAMGCRERPKGALNIAGTRPAGILTAGTAQRFVNRKGYLPGREVVILGSGDIGLIMARRMTLEGARVRAVCELMPYSSGLSRNIEQCLNDFDIPLYTSHTVTEIHGTGRLTGVTVCEVDGQRRPKPETARHIPCDTLLLSCGLIPENELTRGAGIGIDAVTGGARVDADRATDVPGIFACGNVLHVHDLVDYVSEEAAIAGEAAVAFLRGKTPHPTELAVEVDGRVRYTVPQTLRAVRDTKVFFRVGEVLRDVYLVVRSGERELLRRRKLVMKPGEMETVTLTADMLRSCENGKLLFTISNT